MKEGDKRHGRRTRKLDFNLSAAGAQGRAKDLIAFLRRTLGLLRRGQTVLVRVEAGRPRCYGIVQVTCHGGWG